MKSFTYKVVLLSENRITNKKYLDKVLEVEVQQREFNRINALNKIHNILTKQYDTKSRRYCGFQWVCDCSDLK